MKNFLDDDDFSDEIEEVDEMEGDNFTSHHTYTQTERNNVSMKTKTQNKKETKFQEEDFDTKVAKIICNIHNKFKQDKFSEWVNENYSHLRKLYELSGMNMSEEEFYTFMYNHK